MKTLAFALSVATLTGAGAGTALAAPPPPVPQPHVLTVPGDLDTQTGPIADTEESRTTRKAAPASPRLRAAAAPLCAVPAADPVRDGERIVVRLPPGGPFDVATLGPKFWKNPQVADPTWRLYLYSLRWMGPLVARAEKDQQQEASKRLIDAVLRFYVDHPDTGKAVLGWDEGGSLRRLETLNCLYRMTSDKRLFRPMATEANVLFGPRYYGPPRHPVHNHGLMANLRLVEAGAHAGRPDWSKAAGERIRREAGLAFTPKGTSYEQSTGYQSINAELWHQAARTLTELDPKDPVIPTIRATVARARSVSEWVTEPDGGVVQIGDTKRDGGSPASHRSERQFRDDQAGLIVGRWSWKDPNTTYYTVRYGPPRRAHGQPDKASVTWTAAGTRVLVGSGYFSYEAGNPYAEYQKTPQSSNVAIPAAGKLNTAADATVTRTIQRSTRDRWWLLDSVYGRKHARAVDVDHSARLLTVSDVFAGRGSADQFWHLDPSWQVVSAPVGGKVMRYRNKAGQVLEIRTTGVLASAHRGSTRPVAGWNFPAPKQRAANWQLRVRWNAGTVRTTFRLL